MIKNILSRFNLERNLAALCPASFLMSMALGIWTVALPFVIKRFGGTDADVGISFAFNFTAYLIACLAAGLFLDKLNAKRAVQFGCAGIILAMAGFCFMLYADVSRPVLIFNLLGIFQGVCTAVFWPPIMGWLSRGYEGKELGHRLGSFNMAWSSGSWISPYLGGILVGMNSKYPMIAAFAVAVVTFVFIRFARNPNRDSTLASAESACNTRPAIHSNLRRFQWMARVALLVSFIAIGIVRTQLGLLFKFQLGYSEAHYGLAITFMCIGNFVAFWVAGRSHQWHYKPNMFFTSQAFITVSMAMILIFPQLWILFAAAAIIGLAEGFVYNSHLFYGVSGGKNRAGLMAMHEFLLSIGMVIGAVAGGFLSDSHGRFSPYWLGLFVTILGIAIQLVLWLTIKPAVVELVAQSSPMEATGTTTSVR